MNNRRPLKYNIGHSEYLLNNALDRDFQAVLLPIRVLEAITLQAKYVIRDNFITSHNLKTSCIAFIGFLIIMSLHVFDHVLMILPNEPSSMMFVHFTAYAILHGLNFLIITILNIYHSQKYVEILLKLQSVYRSVKIYGNSQCDTRFFWLYGLSFVFLNLASSLYLTIEKQLAFSVLYCQLFIDVNIINFVQIIKVTDFELKIFNKIMHKIINNSLSKTIWDFKIVFSAFEELLDAFHKFKIVSQLKVLIFVIATVIHFIFHLQLSLNMYKIYGMTQNAIETGAIFLIYWIFKNTVHLTMLCLSLEKFYVNLENSHATCESILLNGYCSVELKQLCKNARRKYRVGFSKMNACGAFTVDAILPFSVLNLLVEFTFLILQYI